MNKRTMQKVNRVIGSSTIESLYDYGWLVYQLCSILSCEYYYAEARIEHNGFSLWELENR